MVGETNRLPFDLAEGEGEIVGGFHTEYGSMRFAMFFLGEYVNMFTVSALATTMFLGGWQSPPPLGLIADGALNGGWWGLLWFTLKMWTFMFFFVWLRGSLPRVRYDQFMRFGWKVLIPATIVWVVVLAFLRGAQNGWLGTAGVPLFGRNITYAAIAVGFVLALLVAGVVQALERREVKKATAAPPRPTEIDPFAGGYPVPPLPGQTLLEPERHRPAVGASTVAAKEDVRG